MRFYLYYLANHLQNRLQEGKSINFTDSAQVVRNGSGRRKRILDVGGKQDLQKFELRELLILGNYSTLGQVLAKNSQNVVNCPRIFELLFFIKLVLVSLVLEAAATIDS